MSYHILLVDDSATVRAMIAKTLDAAGIPCSKLYVAKNGKEALSLLDRHWIDLVLTDIHMPEMDGMELVRKMSEDGLMKTVPVIVVSTEGSDDRIGTLKGYGIRGYVRKPFTPEDIREVVEKILGGCHDA